jgi:4-hydroxy-3-methylbut-2-en-1-yl diphosphate reductase
MLDPEWLEGVAAVGVTAGASAPEELVQQLVDRLKQHGDVEVDDQPGVDENMQFKLPRELLRAEDAI